MHRAKTLRLSLVDAFSLYEFRRVVADILAQIISLILVINIRMIHENLKPNTLCNNVEVHRHKQDLNVSLA